jgi:hypothetical protein
MGMVLMQASVALSGVAGIARMGALGAGFLLIGVAALLSAASLQRGVVSQLLLVLLLCALGFEALSAFNGHLVFEPKLIAFRLICYMLLAFGIVIGLGYRESSPGIPSGLPSTLTVALIAIAAPITWRSLEAVVVAEAARGSFDESSPVALGFSSGTLAIAALAVALRSPMDRDYAIGSAGFAMWAFICLQSGSRGALLSLTVASVILFALSLACSPKRVLTLVFVVVVVATGRVAVGDSIAGQASLVLERFESILNLEADASLAGSADSRAYLLDHNLKLPGLLLLGGEGFDPQAYPHNFEVEALVRLGAPLGLIFVLIVLYLLWRMVRVLGAREVDVALCVVFAMGGFAFLNAQTNMMWEVLRPLWLSLGLSVGMLLVTKLR